MKKDLNQERKLYQIDAGYGCGGAVAIDDIIIEAAPIFKWMVGKSIHFIKTKYNVTEVGSDGKNHDIQSETS